MSSTIICYQNIQLWGHESERTCPAPHSLQHWRVGLASCLGRTLELILLSRVQVSKAWGSEGMRAELTSPCPHITLTTIRREGPAFCLDKTVELIMAILMRMTWVWRSESKRIGHFLGVGCIGWALMLESLPG